MNNSKQTKENNDKKKRQGGFTLAEMLVALAILSILLSIGMVFLVHYQRVLKLTEMDTTAREIFVVAQNHITAAKASGEWERLVEKYQDDPDAYLGYSMQQQPSDYPSGDAWPSGGYGDGHDYRYIVYNNKEDTLESTILDRMLPYGAIDEAIRREGSYIIEYDYEAAAVYGVFYTDNSQAISYTKDIMGTSGLNDNNGREASQKGKEARKNYKNDKGHMIIGYYGGAIVKDLKPSKLEPIEIQVDNGDTLKVTIKDKNYGKLIDGVKAKTKLAVTVTGEETKVSETKILEIGKSGVKRRNGEEDWWTVKEEKNARIYTLVLDDITRPGGHFADIFPEFIPGENIMIEVEAFSDQVLCTPVKAQAYTNSLFEANYEYEESGRLASRVTIGNARHLQNLNPEISNIPTQRLGGGQDPKVERIIEKAEQTKSLDWNTFSLNEEQQRTAIYTYDEIVANQKKLSEDKFYGITNTALREYEGNGHTLSHFILQENENGNAGFFAQVGKDKVSQKLIVKNLVLDRFVSESTKVEGNAGTLIGEVQEEGTFIGENIFVTNATVKAVDKGNAGGLVGKMSKGDIKECGIYLTDDESDLPWKKTASEKYELGAYRGDNKIQGSQFMITSSGGAAGGLVGKVENTVINDSFASVPVTVSNSGVAGGLLGKNTGQETVIINSYTGGYTITGKYLEFYGASALGDEGVAGGFIGQDTAKVTVIENSYSAVSTYGNISGGFIGKADSGQKTYKNSYATGKVTGVSESSKRDGFIGEVKGAEAILAKQCYSLKESNKDLASSVSGVTALNYDDLIEATYADDESQLRAEHYSYDQALKGVKYPFRMVTKTGAKNKASNKAHYGDWPVKEEKAAGDMGVVYYEIIDNQLYYHGYLADYSINESEPNYKKVMTDGEHLTNGLITDPGKYVSEDGYMILVPEGTDLTKIVVAAGDAKNNSGERWTLSECVEPLENKNLFSMEGFDVYYFSKELNIYNFTYITLGENISEYYPTFGEYVSLYFNPYLADSVNKEKPVEEKLYIRSARHLLNMGQLEWSHSNKEYLEFIQTLDINYEDMIFTENGKEKAYDYQTIGMISADYTVRQYKSNDETRGYVIKGLKVPLFGTIQPSSVIKGVTLINSHVNGVESFAISNSGVIESCTVRAENPGSDSYSSVSVEAENNVAGFININHGTIKNSYFVGTITGDAVSGFVDTNYGIIENSYANVILSGNSSASGFVSYNNNGTIKNSFVVGSVRSNEDYGISYGFMKEGNHGVMENNYSALFQLAGNEIYRFGQGRGSSYSNCVWLDNTYIEGNVQAGDPYDLKEQGTAVAYEDMIKKGTKPKTHQYNSDYEHVDKSNLVYPFELVTTNEAYLQMEFWGDWPEQDLTMGVGLMDDDEYLSDLSKDNEHPKYEEVMAPDYEDTDELLEEGEKDITEEDVIEEGDMILIPEEIEFSIIDDEDETEDSVRSASPS